MIATRKNYYLISYLTVAYEDYTIIKPILEIKK